MSGPDLQQELKRRRQEVPIIFITITAQGDESVRRQMLARGAAEFCSSRSAKQPDRHV
jgi:FixJ family two-component response regulator